MTHSDRCQKIWRRACRPAATAAGPSSTLFRTSSKETPSYIKKFERKNAKHRTKSREDEG